MSKVKYLLPLLIVALSSGICSAAMASSTSPPINLSMVLRPNPSNTGLDATYGIDCVYGSGYAEYTFHVPTSGGVHGFVGVNWPPLGTGLIPPTGTNASSPGVWIGFNAMVPTGSGSPFPGSRMVIQTTDGIYHMTTSSFSKSGSFAGCSLDHYPYFTNEPDYSPPINPSFDSVNKAAYMFFENPTQGQVEFVWADIFGSNYQCTSGHFNPTITLLNTTDGHFNFEFRRDN
jgi:hypothetical protein